jgi:hypothetical protein
MLKIRPSQLKAFQHVADSALEEEIVRHLREEHPYATARIFEGEFAVVDLPPETLRGMVKTGVARARSYGLTWESSIKSFIVLMFVTAPSFDGHPIIRRILQDEHTPPDDRIERLWESTTDENWEAVAQDYDPGAWGLAQEGR